MPFVNLSGNVAMYLERDPESARDRRRLDLDDLCPHAWRGLEGS
jgi:hypothetical protein